ncbi:hypothetical protein C943_02861 [Mariniradius saccharolyticus AK6]|uniref:Uncharacterized protein n=2 Tax=Mariniradius TaxID=1245590 RepID=M7XC18_9BACT|nr:hypothetical protein C943_02861 [Mariniradius saccharolyticus AK6]
MDAHIKVQSVWDSGKSGFSSLRIFGHAYDSTDKKIPTPKVIARKCDGVFVGGSLIKSLIFSTEIAPIENNDAEGMLAFYPFVSPAKITKATIDFSGNPVISGEGGLPYPRQDFDGNGNHGRAIRCYNIHFKPAI